MTNKFTKPPLSLSNQLDQLLSRGLVVKDKELALHHLSHIGYYRLSGYARTLQIGGGNPYADNFKCNTTFEEILDIYTFDRKLRLLAMDAIERIEISVRAAWSNTIAVKHGAHWYKKSSLFAEGFSHQKYIEDIKKQIGHDPNDKKRRDTHINHYYQTYNTPDMPPSWMVFESITFGTISVTCKNLNCPEFVEICKSFNLPPYIFKSWLHSISCLRNICAHHGRLWNRDFRVQPIVAKAFKSDLNPNNYLYAQVVIMQVLLGKFEQNNNSWAQELHELLNENQSIQLADMGFPKNWHLRKIWKLTS
jgi:abortive infection bacteriophage resistance protein